MIKKWRSRALGTAPPPVTNPSPPLPAVNTAVNNLGLNLARHNKLVKSCHKIGSSYLYLHQTQKYFSRILYRADELNVPIDSGFSGERYK